MPGGRVDRGYGESLGQYGLLAPLGQPLHNVLRTQLWLWRGLAYLVGIWGIEYATGWLLA